MMANDETQSEESSGGSGDVVPGQTTSELKQKKGFGGALAHPIGTKFMYPLLVAMLAGFFGAYVNYQCTVKPQLNSSAAVIGFEQLSRRAESARDYIKEQKSETVSAEGLLDCLGEALDALESGVGNIQDKDFPAAREAWSQGNSVIDDCFPEHIYEPPAYNPEKSPF